MKVGKKMELVGPSHPVLGSRISQLSVSCHYSHGDLLSWEVNFPWQFSQIQPLVCFSKADTASVTSYKQTTSISEINLRQTGFINL